MNKPFKTTNEQITILQNRGLIIQDIDYARSQLNEKGYFNLINGFETLLLEPYAKNSHINQKKYQGKYFEDFVSLYEFDRRLAMSILDNIACLEIKLKSLIPQLFHKHKTSTSSISYLDYIDRSKYLTCECDLFKDEYKIFGRLHGHVNRIVSNHGRQYKLDFTGNFDTEFSRKNFHGGILELHIPSSVTSALSVGVISHQSIVLHKNNYIEWARSRYDYIGSLNNPPFWMVIKTFTFGQLIELIKDLDSTVLGDLLNQFNYLLRDKEAFFRALEIISKLRNHCAHFELVNRFRTLSNLEIHTYLITTLSLTPKRSNYIIKLYDVLKVLRHLTSIETSSEIIRKYILENKLKRKEYINISLLDRMGNQNEQEWKNL